MPPLTPLTPRRGGFWPLSPSQEPHSEPPVGRNYNLKLVREIVTHMGIIDECYGMKCQPTFRSLGRDTPKRLLAPDAFLQHNLVIDDKALRLQVVRLSKRLLQAAHGIRIGHGQPVPERYTQQVRTLIQRTESPRLYMDVLLAMTPSWEMCFNRALDELLLTVSLRMWCNSSRDLKPWRLFHTVLEEGPQRWRTVHSINREVSYRQRLLSSRALQFVIEAERTATLQMLVERVTAYRLPAEMSDTVFSFLLEMNDLVHPREMVRTWRPWPSNRECLRPKMLAAFPRVDMICSANETCPAQIRVGWDARLHRFDYWHHGQHWHSERHVSCREGRCEPHHVVCKAKKPGAVMKWDSDCEECVVERYRREMSDSCTLHPPHEDDPDL